MSARLIVEAGAAAPTVFDLSAAEAVEVGRHRTSQLVLHDQHASRHHARLYRRQDVWYVCDLGTTNGTRVNGLRVQADTPLADSQVITIGNVRIRFRQHSGDGPPPDVPGPVPLDDDTTTNLEPDEMTALLRFTSASFSEGTLQSLVGRALDSLVRQARADFAGFLSLDSDHPELHVVRPERAGGDERLSQQLTQAVLRRGRSVWLNDRSTDRPESESLARFHDAVCVPVSGGRRGDPPLGAIHLYSRGRVFSERQVRFAEAVAASLSAALQVLRSRLSLEADNDRLRAQAPAADELVGSSPAMEKLRGQVRRLADAPCSVLITGESGVGKELVALGLHRLSSRHRGPLVTVNCAAIAGSLAEQELFGHARDAYTGVSEPHVGYFAQADTGTLFLDELGELSLDLQAKLLRAIESKSFRPIKARADSRSDVRVIAATNRDLERAVREGRFRRDLFYRLTARIAVPPLRDHLEDVPELAQYFLEHFSREYRREVQLSPAAMERLMACRWPGNVRQLRSVLEAAVANTWGQDTLHAGDLYLIDELGKGDGEGPPGLNLEVLEQWAIRRALRECGDNVTKAARALGIHRETLGLKMKKYGIERGEGAEG